MSQLNCSQLLEKLGVSMATGGVCIDGQWQKGTGPICRVENPATRELIAEFSTCGPEQYDQAVASAQTCFQAWRTVPAPARGQLVRDLGNELRENKETIATIMSLEMGKTFTESVGEVQEMIDICDFAVGLSRQLYGLTIATERPQHSMRETWHPLGPVAVISAFNFPVAVWSWNAAVAAVCGDSSVWKPSQLAPLCAMAVQSLCNKVMAKHNAAGLFNLTLGGADLGKRMTEDSRFPLVSFTGSIAAGKQVAGTVASRLGRSILELGGNNALIVTDDADLGLATRAITFGAAGTSGQRCTTTRRVYAHENVIGPLATQLVSAFPTVSIGDPMENGVLMGPLIDEAAVVAYEKAIETALKQGGELLCGGKRVDRPGHFVEPTIIRAPRGEFPIAQEETFAPILYLFEVKNVDEAIELNNAVRQGLSSAIFTNSMQSAEQFLSAVGSDCGIANVNTGTSGAEIGGAFGGEKETGGGRESGSDAWKGYMRRQTSTINWGRDLPLAQGVEFS